MCMYTAESQQGHARYARDLLTALAEAGQSRGVEVSLVTRQDLAQPYRSTAYPIHAILPTLVHKSEFRSRWSWVRSRLDHYVTRERIFLDWVKAQPDLDLIHFQEFTPWLAPVYFPRMRRMGLDVAATVHNIANHALTSRVYRHISQRCWRRAWRSCSVLLVHTEGLRSTLSGFLGPGHPPIHVTPHAVWEERTEPVRPTCPRPGEPTRLLFFGMIRENKGLHVLLRAMRKLPDVHLTIAGSPDADTYFTRIEAAIAELPPGRVDVVPHFLDESEIAGYFDRTHLVVLPYTAFASQSGVLHQALAHGRPVVATDVGGLGECVRAWKIGRVVAPRDDQALAEGILEMSQPDRYQEAAHSINCVRDELSWKRMAESTIDAYHSVMR